MKLNKKRQAEIVKHFAQALADADDFSCSVDCEPMEDAATNGFMNCMPGPTTITIRMTCFANPSRRLAIDARGKKNG